MNPTLLHNFYRITSTDYSGDLTSFHTGVTLEPAHAIFHGHFPELPVVPGVVLVQMIREILELNSGKNLSLRSADNIKFLSMVNPKEKKDLEFKIETEAHGDQILCKATCKAGDQVCVKFKGLFIADNAGKS